MWHLVMAMARPKKSWGRALHGRQEPVVIATKVRLAAAEMHDVAGAVRTSVEASLRRLRREIGDVLHVHNRFTPQRGDLLHSLSAADALGPLGGGGRHTRWCHPAWVWPHWTRASRLGMLACHAS